MPEVWIFYLDALIPIAVIVGAWIYVKRGST